MQIPQPAKLEKRPWSSLASPNIDFNRRQHFHFPLFFLRSIFVHFAGISACPWLDLCIGCTRIAPSRVLRAAATTRQGDGRASYSFGLATQSKV